MALAPTATPHKDLHCVNEGKPQWTFCGWLYLRWQPFCGGHFVFVQATLPQSFKGDCRPQKVGNPILGRCPKERRKRVSILSSHFVVAILCPCQRRCISVSKVTLGLKRLGPHLRKMSRGEKEEVIVLFKRKLMVERKKRVSIS